MQLQNNAITEFFIGSFFCQIEHTERLQTVSYFIYSLSFLVYALYIGHRLCHLRNNTYIYIYIYIYTGWRKKKLTCLIYFNLKTKRAITPKLRALHSVLSNLNFDIYALSGMPEPRVQRVQVHPLPFAFSTLWVQCGCRLGVQPVHTTFTTDRIKSRSRICVGVFHPAVVRNSAKLLSNWRKVKRKALLMEFLARNYGGIVPK